MSSTNGGFSWKLPDTKVLVFDHGCAAGCSSRDKWLVMFDRSLAGARKSRAHAGQPPCEQQAEMSSPNLMKPPNSPQDDTALSNATWDLSEEGAQGPKHGVRVRESGAHP